MFVMEPSVVIDASTVERTPTCGLRWALLCMAMEVRYGKTSSMNMCDRGVLVSNLIWLW